MLYCSYLVCCDTLKLTFECLTFHFTKTVSYYKVIKTDKHICLVFNSDKFYFVQYL